MKRSSQMITLICTFSVPLSLAHAKDDGHDKDRATIKADYAAMDKACENKDADGASAYIAENYVSINREGVEDIHGKAEDIALIRQLFTIAPDLTTQTTLTALSFNKQGVTVLNTAVITGTLTRDGAKHILSITGTYRDLWVKSSDGWLEKRSRSLTNKRTIDGKPVK